MFVVYGIRNCDSVKTACAWLEKQNISYRFHDYRVDGLDVATLERFINTLGIEQLLNKRSTSWKQLSEAQRGNLNPDQALQLMLTIPTLIKRPIIDTGEKLIVGFDPEQYAAIQ